MKKYLLASCLALIATPAAADELSCANIPNTECADLGFTQSEANCENFLSLKCPFDQTKLYCEGICGVGAILYSDGSCSFKKQSNKTAVGVIFDTTNRLAVSLTMKNGIVWGGRGTDIEALESCLDKSTVITTCGTDGKSNTAAIVAQLGTDSKYAARYCYELTEGDQAAGSWWLPSMKELYTLYANKTAVNAGLTTAGVTATLSTYFWASTRLNTTEAWRLTMSNGGVGNGNKDTIVYYTRCVTSY